MVTLWKARRFWKEATAGPAEGGGWEVLLDGRPLRTPAKAPLILPTEALARAIAAEWQAQGEEIDPAAMPMTRTANTAIDRVRAHRADVERELAGYGETDLTCYRAEAPQALAALQAEAWDPLLDWAHARFGARLLPVEGIIHQPQDARALAALAEALAAVDEFRLAALHELVTLSGSLVIGLAAAEGMLAPEELWQRSRVDEEWQIAQWGRDEEAEAAAALKREAFLTAAEFCRLAAPV
ncbi:Chaperone required for the assembly of the F1-ATPase [Meinhardsimonia xiamenensis]|jgi:chaperone required for assembly of F1-ATPase|uniref:Chaperone required for the assembly of the F1-ATPase n=1 Tax=Meinhardsimonia xiamenensis TaxID=990712 RepID=A0A1G9A9L7_9RHOB|nr:chaperone required for assembly of F1-ATPase [Meinhardsimonia xiamenensis]SDK24062.1 Chaperone required for the assembly of the F1-ATPase [Meinhardsimonia xiamenensis]